ncbi:MAG: biopolymer transporter ExbD [Verrucomicrobiota bacterium]|jgi:biopolymer transport protein ExbD
MKKRKHSHHGTLTELNITPLLDLVFVLLVIFIITTPQMMNNLEMALPSGKPPVNQPNQPKPKINKIAVDAKGRIQLNGESVVLAALKDRLIQLKTHDSGLGVVVEGADDVDYQIMVDVLDLLRQLEITKVGLATAGA